MYNSIILLINYLIKPLFDLLEIKIHKNSANILYSILKVYTYL